MIQTGTIVNLKGEGDEKFIIWDIYVSKITDEVVYEIKTVAQPELVSLRYEREIIYEPTI
jgi:hypothetical protein